MKLTVDQQSKTPGEWAAEGCRYDCTGEIGQLGTDCAWPMYSFERPASILWNAIASELNKRGWSDDEIKSWLQSKNPRWALDQDLGDLLVAIGEMYAKQITKEEIDFK